MLIDVNELLSDTHGVIWVNKILDDQKMIMVQLLDKENYKTILSDIAEGMEIMDGKITLVLYVPSPDGFGWR